VIVALNIAAMSEALTLATKAGVNPDLVYQAIRGGLAGSTVLDAKAPMVMDRNFKPGFRIDLHIKDLANALDTSHGVGAQLPLTAAVMEMMQALRADGLEPPTIALWRAITKNWRKWKSLANKLAAHARP
jgi:2-hydroxy-3-oxopropionate reductase